MSSLLLLFFQEEIGSISSDMNILEENSVDMGLRLKNRRVAESKLAKFVEELIVPPKMIDVIVDAEVYDFIVRKLIALRKPKTNIQILQQSVLLKYNEHGKEVFVDVRAAYIDTMNKVVSTHFRAYIQAVEKLQLDIATSYDLIGVETRTTSLFSIAREPLKNRSAIFALGERIKIIKEIDEPALIPHIILAEDSCSNPERSITVAEVEPLLRDFGDRWKTEIEAMDKDIMKSFSNSLCGMDILKAVLTQLLLYYTRLTYCIKKTDVGSALNMDVVNYQSIAFEIKKYFKTF
ncbi:Vacuolar protein sorting-associated protein 52 A [Cardamine amara subsp. amara]|uniref:Vacuolar protein sorting-associated protein 52 A n=1 Tax=Cardamine amara subsp. amara TaxID=228776 RepID=A0ABD1B250_CARAN